MDQLALHGGKPARSKPLPPMLRGALVYGEEEVERVAQVARAGSPFRYYGPDLQNFVARFEDKMAKSFQVPYVLGVSSGTAALMVALKSLGIGYGDKVIIPANTFTATAGAVICSNAVPVFAEMDETLNMDPSDLERVYDDEVRAIIAVHINGAPSDMDGIMEFAKKHGLYVVEDVAQSLGCSYHGRLGGTIGDVGAFSFQMQKILTAGEGGAILARDPEIFERAVRYHDQGGFRDKKKYGLKGDNEDNWIVGQNYRMNEFAGAAMFAQWDRFDDVVGTMRKHHRRIKETVKEEIPYIQFRESADSDGDIGCVLGIVHPNQEEASRFMEAINAENIMFYLMYGGKPIYVTPAFMAQRTADRDNFPFNYPYKKPVVYSEGMCPRTEELMQRITIMQVSPTLTDEDTNQIIEGIIKVYKGLNLGVGASVWQK